MNLDRSKLWSKKKSSDNKKRLKCGHTFDDNQVQRLAQHARHGNYFMHSQLPTRRAHGAAVFCASAFNQWSRRRLLVRRRKAMAHLRQPTLKQLHSNVSPCCWRRTAQVNSRTRMRLCLLAFWPHPSGPNLSLKSSLTKGALIEFCAPKRAPSAAACVCCCELLVAASGSQGEINSSSIHYSSIVSRDTQEEKTEKAGKVVVVEEDDEEEEERKETKEAFTFFHTSLLSDATKARANKLVARPLLPFFQLLSLILMVNCFTTPTLATTTTVLATATTTTTTTAATTTTTTSSTTSTKQPEPVQIKSTTNKSSRVNLSIWWQTSDFLGAISKAKSSPPRNEQNSLLNHYKGTQFVISSSESTKTKTLAQKEQSERVRSKVAATVLHKSNVNASTFGSTLLNQHNLSQDDKELKRSQQEQIERILIRAKPTSFDRIDERISANKRKLKSRFRRDARELSFFTLARNYETTTHNRQHELYYANTPTFDSQVAAKLSKQQQQQQQQQSNSPQTSSNNFNNFNIQTNDELIELLALFYAHTQELQDSVQREFKRQWIVILKQQQNRNQYRNNNNNYSLITRDGGKLLMEIKMKLAADDESLMKWLRQQQERFSSLKNATFELLSESPNRTINVCPDGPKILVLPNVSEILYCYTKEQWIDKLWNDLRLSAFHYPIIVLNILIFLFGTTGNIFVCLSVYRNHQLRNVTNYFIVNLAFADFLVILICLPATVVWDLSLTWFFGTIPCKLIMFLQVSRQSKANTIQGYFSSFFACN